ncbi:hypothetical protein ACQEVF_20345 [Nonomuraea polychroma]|uniref:hypothetical protein n=1 Tax=Nonomuraea polychroma TaxID=46176 RepID=UPI003D923C36
MVTLDRVADRAARCGGLGIVGRYSRVVVKLSGEALAGPSGWGADPERLARLADEL